VFLLSEICSLFRKGLAGCVFTIGEMLRLEADSHRTGLPNQNHDHDAQ
jgi:hypothetical protein